MSGGQEDIRAQLEKIVGKQKPWQPRPPAPRTEMLPYRSPDLLSSTAHRGRPKVASGRKLPSRRSRAAGEQVVPSYGSFSAAVVPQLGSSTEEEEEEEQVDVPQTEQFGPLVQELKGKPSPEKVGPLVQELKGKPSPEKVGPLVQELKQKQKMSPEVGHLVEEIYPEDTGEAIETPKIAELARVLEQTIRNSKNEQQRLQQQLISNANDAAAVEALTHSLNKLIEEINAMEQELARLTLKPAASAGSPSRIIVAGSQEEASVPATPVEMPQSMEDAADQIAPTASPVDDFSVTMIKMELLATNGTYRYVAETVQKIGKFARLLHKELIEIDESAQSHADKLAQANHFIQILFRGYATLPNLRLDGLSPQEFDASSSYLDVIILMRHKVLDLSHVILQLFGEVTEANWQAIGLVLERAIQTFCEEHSAMMELQADCEIFILSAVTGGDEERKTPQRTRREIDEMANTTQRLLASLNDLAGRVGSIEQVNTYLRDMYVSHKFEDNESIGQIVINLLRFCSADVPGDVEQRIKTRIRNTSEADMLKLRTLLALFYFCVSECINNYNHLKDAFHSLNILIYYLKYNRRRHERTQYLGRWIHERTDKISDRVRRVDELFHLINNYFHQIVDMLSIVTETEPAAAAPMELSPTPVLSPSTPEERPRKLSRASLSTAPTIRLSQYNPGGANLPLEPTIRLSPESPAGRTLSTAPTIRLSPESPAGRTLSTAPTIRLSPESPEESGEATPEVGEYTPEDAPSKGLSWMNARTLRQLLDMLRQLQAVREKDERNYRLVSELFRNNPYFNSQKSQLRNVLARLLAMTGENVPDRFLDNFLLNQNNFENAAKVSDKLRQLAATAQTEFESLDPLRSYLEERLKDALTNGGELPQKYRNATNEVRDRAVRAYETLTTALNKILKNVARLKFLTTEKRQALGKSVGERRHELFQKIQANERAIRKIELELSYVSTSELVKNELRQRMEMYERENKILREQAQHYAHETNALNEGTFEATPSASPVSPLLQLDKLPTPMRYQIHHKETFDEEVRAFSRQIERILKSMPDFDLMDQALRTYNPNFRTISPAGVNVIIDVLRASHTFDSRETGRDFYGNLSTRLDQDEYDVLIRLVLRVRDLLPDLRDMNNQMLMLKQNVDFLLKSYEMDEKSIKIWEDGYARIIAHYETTMQEYIIAVQEMHNLIRKPQRHTEQFVEQMRGRAEKSDREYDQFEAWLRVTQQFLKEQVDRLAVEKPAAEKLAADIGLGAAERRQLLKQLAVDSKAATILTSGTYAVSKTQTSKEYLQQWATMLSKMYALFQEAVEEARLALDGFEELYARTDIRGDRRLAWIGELSKRRAAVDKKMQQVRNMNQEVERPIRSLNGFAESVMKSMKK